MVNLRTASADQFVIVDERTGAILGTMEQSRVFRQAHPGAVYLHLGESYLVRRLDLQEHLVLVGEHSGVYYTQAKVDKNVLVAGQSATRALPERGGPLLRRARGHGAGHRLPEARPHRQSRPRDQPAGPARAGLHHRGAVVHAAAAADRVPAAPTWAATTQDGQRLTAGSLHAAEHALIAILPLYAMCDRWDIGGLSTAWHWQTDQATVFIYDGYPGGIGLTRRGYHAFEHLAADAHTLVGECPCESGCPSCIQSPKCGNLNEPLSKAGALWLLDAVLHTRPAAAH